MDYGFVAGFLIFSTTSADNQDAGFTVSSWLSQWNGLDTEMPVPRTHPKWKHMDIKILYWLVLYQMNMVKFVFTCMIVCHPFLCTLIALYMCQTFCLTYDWGVGVGGYPLWNLQKKYFMFHNSVLSKRIG